MRPHDTTKLRAHTCRRCGKEWRDYYPDRTHCSRACRDADRQKRVSVVCQQCSTSFEVAVHRTDTAQYCSRACKHAAMVVRVALTCQTCAATYFRDASRAVRSRYCSATCQAAGRRTGRTTVALTCEECGQSYQKQVSAAARSRFCSRSCRTIWVVKHSSKRGTSIERAVAALLDADSVVYEPQKHIGVYLCDFYIPSARLVIECDGTYWHSKAEQVFKDVRRDAWLKSHGYQVLRLSEDKINTDLDWCRAQIHRFLAGAKDRKQRQRG